MAPSYRRLISTHTRQKAPTMTSLSELAELFLDYHRRLGSSPATIRHYDDSLKLLLRCCAEHQLDPVAASLSTPTMNNFAAWLRATPTRPWRGSTERSIYGVHGALKDVKIWLKWLMEHEYVPAMPTVPVPRLPKTLYPILSDAELERVFACDQVSGRSEMAIRNRALLGFMLDTAVRLSEVAGLTLSDVDLEEGSARIRGKGGKERLVYLSRSASDSLVSWLSIRGQEPGSLFWLEASGIAQLFKRIKQETGLPLFTPHQLRHTSLTMLVRDGVDLHTIKRLAGHASVTTTESYLALASQDIRDKHRAASPFDRIYQQRPAASPPRRRLRSS
jgi:site-specific recombinase XerD